MIHNLEAFMQVVFPKLLVKPNLKILDTKISDFTTEYIESMEIEFGVESMIEHLKENPQYIGFYPLHLWPIKKPDNIESIALTVRAEAGNIVLVRKDEVEQKALLKLKENGQLIVNNHLISESLQEIRKDLNILVQDSSEIFEGLRSKELLACVCEAFLVDEESKKDYLVFQLNSKEFGYFPGQGSWVLLTFKGHPLANKIKKISDRKSVEHCNIERKTRLLFGRPINVCLEQDKQANYHLWGFVKGSKGILKAKVSQSTKNLLPERLVEQLKNLQ